MTGKQKSWPLWLSLAWAALGSLQAADPVAAVTLSTNEIALGEAAQLTIEVTGARRVTPAKILVSGLEIEYRGESMSIRSVNSQTSISSQLSYVVSARQAGRYTIPAVLLETDKGVVRTKPLDVVVLEAALRRAPSASNPAGSQPASFAEISVPKKTLYVGETMPLEVRLYVDSKLDPLLEQLPTIDGEGFTRQKVPKPRESQERREGRDYEVRVFRTAITPGKAGKIVVGPVEIPFVASIPRERRNRGSSFFNDPLLDDFLNGQFGSLAQRQRTRATAPAVELEVKPLPAAGRPQEFSGAIGKFELKVEGAPEQVKVGDPVTMKVRIIGEGNFDRVNAPSVISAKGWQVFPPTSEFEPQDEVGVRGEKIFEIAVAPEEKKDSMPMFRFSYFDPDAKKYVTLDSERKPLVVEGGAAASPPPVSTGPAAAPRTVAPQDIVGLRYDFGRPVRSFEPVYRTRGFWLAQLVPFGALLCLIGWRWLRPDSDARCRAEWRREKQELWKRLRREQARADFFQSAARLLQLETALAAGRSPATVDGAAALASRPLDETTRKAVEEIFDSRAAALYAGTAPAETGISESERERVNAAVQRFEQSHAQD